MFYGHIYKNKHQRSGRRDPNLLGWLEMPIGKFSVAGWHDKASGNIKLTLRPYTSKQRIFSYGMIQINRERIEDLNHPHMLGTIEIGGEEYSLGAWLHSDKNGQPYFQMTVKEMKDVNLAA